MFFGGGAVRLNCVAPEYVMARLPVIRGVHCRECGHNTRLFASRCGRCGVPKTLWQRMPGYLLRSGMLLAVVAVLVVGNRMMR